MKIREYPKITELLETDVFVLDREGGGTKIVELADLIEQALGSVSVEIRRSVFRGKNLGSVVTTAQKTAIQNGSFDGLWLGDYWVINGVTWRIADFDYWLRCGDTDFTSHHLIIVPDKSLYTATMNATNITTGGYVGSLMYTQNLNNAKTAVRNAFGTMLLTHREYLINAVHANGYPSGGILADSEVELMNEIMVYGSHIFTPAGTGSVIVTRYTINNSQLALFQHCPRFIKIRENYWLRDVVSAAHFADVTGYGNAGNSYASNSYGVRPVFAIG